MRIFGFGLCILNGVSVFICLMFFSVIFFVVYIVLIDVIGIKFCLVNMLFVCLLRCVCSFFILLLFNVMLVVIGCFLKCGKMLWYLDKFVNKLKFLIFFVEFLVIWFLELIFSIIVGL